MNFEELNDENFIFYAASNYLNPKSITIDEFYEDLNHIKYIKRLINRYINHNELRINLIINHLILLYNVFDSSAMTKMLFYKLDDSNYPILKPFLIQLNYLPSNVGKINTDMIPLDQIVCSALRVLAL
jgi:hypothetical protein